MQIYLGSKTIESYQTFLNVRRCPVYKINGRMAEVPDEFASKFGMKGKKLASKYCPIDGLFDYQRDIADMAIKKKKYAVFLECGLGKSLIAFEFCRHAVEVTGKKILIVCPLMVARQSIAEAEKFYGPKLDIGHVSASQLETWLGTKDAPSIGITNFEAIRQAFDTRKLCGLVIDESSMLKSAYGAWGERLIEMGRGLEFKLCLTGTPAPNDRIEFANHAVFLDRCRTVNEFLATYFINRGQTQNRWELKPHALKPFYRSLANWAIFMTNPATYGWKDNVGTMPPINVHIHDVPLTHEQRLAAQTATGNLITVSMGGIGDRGKLSQIAKGKDGMPTNKPGYIRDLIASWPSESTLVWCKYNQEQETMESVLSGCASIHGTTSEEARYALIDDFKQQRRMQLVTKPKILGYGLNLQVATRQVFSGICDSFELYHQAVKRSNRVGSTRELNVHIPVTELETPFIDNVLRKADRVQQDTEAQESMFKEIGYDFVG